MRDGCDTEVAELVKFNRDRDGVSGINESEMYVDCGFWWRWICGGEEVGLGGDVRRGLRMQETLYCRV